MDILVKNDKYTIEKVNWDVTFRNKYNYYLISIQGTGGRTYYSALLTAAFYEFKKE